MKLTIEKVHTKLDGFDIYSLFKENLDTILLDSVRDKETLGRYSFIGVNCFFKFKSKNGMCNTFGEAYAGNTFEELNKILKEYHIENNTELPFVAGGMGYFSYDLGRELEELPNIAKEDIDIPHCCYNFYDNIIIIDNLKKNTYISALGILKSQKDSIYDIKGRIQNGNKVRYEKVGDIKNEFISDFQKSQYINTLSKVRSYIKSGDIYITNLSQRYSCSIKRNAYEIYKDLRHINPAPFAAFMNFEDFNIICSSPERFLSIKDRMVETRPIKGTMPRGKDVDEDNRNKNILINSEKDKAELLNVVDLERNDLSKVCKPNSVKVTQLFKLEEYSTVFHLVSTVVGKLKEEVGPIECIKACFPGGSITGTPKIRSMEIIEELEPVRRNIYTGALGYLGFDGNVDLNIVIRTILIKGNKAYFGVGGGITWDSNEESEYDETLDKARALMRVL
ncbi:aminodeoxychorismate synthase component I [Clostridium estertheticum]|uniref:Anthranilate synthase component 1 n=1 Tax=Clostridium estertheticum TaxID=238834 RepID=A0AA47I7X4_9CLOT|nr:aminodeoxychorismate synthase component I [Clostridium estertheticum]MBU3153461.1 aminodeoxychorismate synthase component I [Clostridium estertheticum]WAG60864.1 aminodeoxychorismate synthase component I [Clostridium estertheticum]